MKKSILIITCLCISLSSCSQGNKITKEDYLIISKVIDDFSFPFAPPPPIGSIDTIIPSKKVDSLSKVKMTIAINPVMESTMDRQGIGRLPERFKKIIDTTLENKNLTNIGMLLSKKKHSIKLAKTQKLRESYNYVKFDLLYNFSRIWYNNDRTLAVLEVGVSKSKLSGYATTLCLKKTEGTWFIVKSIPTTIW